MLVKDIKEQLIMVYGEPVVITQDTIEKTCEWYATNTLGCIAEVKYGGVFVNNPEKYVKDKLAEARGYIEKDFEAGLWFWQRALYIQEGKGVPMLP